MPQRPRVTVAAIIEQDRRFLLVEETASGRLMLNQPAGHVEPGETLEAAVAREALEESAWHFRPTALVGIYLWSSPLSGRSFLRAVYTGDALGREPGMALDDGIVRTLWMTRDEIAAASARLRSPMVLGCVEDYLAGRRYPLHVVSSLLQPPTLSVVRAG
jgi:NADH pyrophosphatase NudC (nudix superfamily)